MSSKGVVTDIVARMVNTKYGPKEAYDIFIDSVKYSGGFKRPPITIGETVEFDYTTDKYGHKITSIRPAGAGVLVSLPAPIKAASGSSYQPRVFPVPIESGERAILRQNALTNARELVTAFLSVDIPNDGKKEVQKTFNSLADEVIRIAYMFEEFTSGDRERHAAEEIMKKGKTAEDKSA